MTWRVCQEAKKCPNVYLWLWSFTTTACSYMPEIQWICLCLFCTCNVYSFAFGILSNRWSSKSPHFAWHSSTWALGQAEPILDLHNVHLCPSPGPSPSTPSNLTFLKTFHTVYHVNASDLQSWSDPDARRCLFRKPAWSRLLSEVSVFVTWLWFFAFASWKYWVMSEIRDRFVIFSSGTHCNEPHVQSDLSNNTQQNSWWTLSLTKLQLTRCLPGRGDKTLRTESCIIVPDEIMIIIVCKFSVDHKRILYSR